jgi:hypothetical protein
VLRLFILDDRKAIFARCRSTRRTSCEMRWHRKETGYVGIYATRRRSHFLRHSAVHVRIYDLMIVYMLTLRCKVGHVNSAKHSISLLGDAFLDWHLKTDELMRTSHARHQRSYHVFGLDVPIRSLQNMGVKLRRFQRTLNIGQRRHRGRQAGERSIAVVAARSRGGSTEAACVHWEPLNRSRLGKVFILRQRRE